LIKANAGVFRLTGKLEQQQKYHVVETSALREYCQALRLPLDTFRLGRALEEEEHGKVEGILGRLQEKVSSHEDFDVRVRLCLHPQHEQFPIPVCNGQLLDGQRELREDLEVHKDYYLVAEELWEQMQAWNVFTVDCDIATVLYANDE